MLDIIKIELYKLYKCKKYIVTAISLSIFLLITFIVSYSLKETKYTYNSYLYYIFSINSGLTFPIIISILFSSLIVDEFKNGTIKVLISSHHKRDAIYMGKFIAANLFYLTIFIFFISIYTIFLAIYFKIKNYEIFLLYSKNETIIRWALVFLTQIVYLSCYSSFIYLISWVIKKKSLTILISLSSIVIFGVMTNIPDTIKSNFFMTNFKIYKYLYVESFNLSEILINLSVNVCTICLFLVAGIILTKNSEVY